jgi:F0F1-type ATP synthase delta subunit
LGDTLLDLRNLLPKLERTVNGQITSAPPLSSEDLDKILTTSPKYGIEIIASAS